MLSKPKLLVVTALLLAGGTGWLIPAGDGPEKHGAQPLGDRGGRLNPHGFPQIAACETISLNDPVAEAAANIAKGDLRPFTVYGYTEGDVPGLFCPSGDYHMESRGGRYVSDIPDACGTHSFTNAPDKAMWAYNRALAEDQKFQEITGCRPATYCEERYRKGYSGAIERDPQCPREPSILSSVAEQNDPAKLKEVLKDFEDGSSGSRDAITSAFIRAINRARWPNAEILLDAGADINGRLRDDKLNGQKWMRSPLAEVFNQNGDTENKIHRAKWLFANGANFSNPHAHGALSVAASSNDVEAVNFLLEKGASPNGDYPKEELDRLAKGNISSAGGGFGYPSTPFYAAIYGAARSWGRRTQDEKAHADAEHRKGRTIAITLYRAGGRFAVGGFYDELRHKPDIKLASIILAAAHREGRLDDLVERLLYPNGRERPALPDDASFNQKNFIAYLQKVEACSVVRPVSKGDYMKLCAYGDV